MHLFLFPYSSLLVGRENIRERVHHTSSFISALSSIRPTVSLLKTIQINMPISEKTPADRARLDSLIRLLKERDGVLERETWLPLYVYQKSCTPVLI